MRVIFFLFVLVLISGHKILLAQPANDNQASATALTLNTCSGDASETTVAATADGAGSSCYGSAPTYNVWYTFVANATGEIEITVDRGGSKGTLRRGVVTLYDIDGSTELACNAWVNDGDDIVVSYSGLVNLSTYYIAVDNHVTAGYSGTFEICINDQAGYDIKEGAQPLAMDACSADAAYTTVGGTADLPGSTCYGSAPTYNRWFSFVATTTSATVTVDRGGSKGTLRRAVVTIYNSSFIEMACNAWVSDGDDVVVSALGLTPANTYYVSVDNHVTGGYRGSFTMCLSSTLDYDYQAGAEPLTMDACSADAAYTTIGATADGSGSSCYGSAPTYNRWFSFVATATGSVTVTVDRGGSKGTLRRSVVTIYDTDGTSELACNNWVSDGDDVVVSALGLTNGLTYYISVDNHVTGGYRGTFTMCLSSTLDYDYQAGAEPLAMDACSADAAYTTIGATADGSGSSCYGSAPTYNRWFSFVATATGTVTVTVDRGGSKGTLRRSVVTIYDTDGTSELACNNWVSDGDDVVVSALGLSNGLTYFISVDNHVTGGYRGTFTMCLSSTLDYDYQGGAEPLTINSCSADAAYTTIGATADTPGSACAATPNYNRWFSFTANSTEQITVTVDRGGSKGTIRRSVVTIFDNTLAPLACNRWVSDGDDVIVSALGLNDGDTYYISVDNHVNGGYRGTFTICLSDQLDYDYQGGAESLTMDACSADAAYTTIGATADGSGSSCYGSAPTYNRWFSFVATSTGNVTVTVDRGGSKGTLRRSIVTIYDTDGATELACNAWVSDGDDVVVSALGLTDGLTYYISVDNHLNGGYRGTFTICLSSALDYDYQGGAFVISDINNWCSSDAQFTTIGATADAPGASCYGSAPSYNRWFQFVATTPFINVTVDRGGSKGTLRRTVLAIWDTDGTTELACNTWVSDGDDVSISALTLTPGQTYYISVDNHVTGGYRGTFTLCVDDEPDYDFYEGAIELTDLNAWCSPDAAYSTIGATDDQSAGSCWVNGPNYNRWFKFTAVNADVTIEVRRGGSEGTIRRVQLALWEADGTTQVDCQRYVADGDNVSIANGTLLPGNDYYISVDNHVTGGYRGTFTLCIDNINQTYYSRQTGNWDDLNSWSTLGYGMAAGTDYPRNGDVANISGYDITVGAASAAAQVNVDASNGATNLNVDAALVVNGQFNIDNAGDNNDLNITIGTGGSITVLDNATFTRAGGANTFDITLNTGSSFLVNRDLIWNSSAGTVANSTMTVNGSATVTVNEDLLFTYSGGQKILLSFLNTSTFSVNRDIEFIATGDDLAEISMNNTSTLNLGRQVIRGTPAYGLLTFNDNTTLVFNSNTYLSTFPEEAGSGGSDVFTFQNVTVNNTRLTSPQVTMEGDVTLPGALTMTDGNILSTSANLLTLGDGATTSGASADSFVDGPLGKIGVNGNANFEFPIGNNAQWAPVTLQLTVGDGTTVMTAEYVDGSYADVSNFQNPDPNGVLNNVSSVEYWDISHTAGTAPTANVTLHWKDIGRSDIDDAADLIIAHYDTGDSEWDNLSKDAISGLTMAGFITKNGVTTFSPFTFGSTDPVLNPLPVELISFTSDPLETSIELHWETVSEYSNIGFRIEKSLDGRLFEAIGFVDAVGATGGTYHFVDAFPKIGLQYYRLVQVDFDGTEHFSDIVVADFQADKLLSVYPNPTTSMLNVNYLGQLSEIVRSYLVDAHGRLVQEVPNPTNLSWKVDLDMVRGAYILVVETTERTIRKRIVKR